MENNTRKILMLIDTSGNEFQADNLNYFAHIVKNHIVETIVIGEVNTDTNVVIWEKQFVEATVMPSNFGSTIE